MDRKPAFLLYRKVTVKTWQLDLGLPASRKASGDKSEKNFISPRGLLAKRFSS